ncbi:methyltransferase domain-containing protein [Paraclostridium sordellii]|uniref:class I SAM-dependent methyltransferase n=1 Tax=Paraclostridium sordellii TaxID=1505 RepID=UPI0005E4C171|nr:methyltransferase domain-containing protein [Paeniclostridium sordellii]CEN85154.1 Methyltransferase domain [[Clostridium] sordellii] [Paeniclostridium sordellii]CEQ13428.1 Methyltransferase domain [[Clostridium] sordellii] [Paeniclostridium sordellii]
MKSVVQWSYESNYFAEDAEEDILSIIRYNIGERVLLVGNIGTLGKRLRMLGVHVTILEDSAYHDICYSLIHNENCSVVKGCLELLPFSDHCFDKVIVLNQFNYTNNQSKALKEIHRVLNSSGEVILQDPNLEKLKTKLKCIKHRLCGERIKYHSPKEIAKKLECLNFTGVLENLKSDKYIYIGKKIIED